MKGLEPHHPGGFVESSDDVGPFCREQTVWERRQKQTHKHTSMGESSEGERDPHSGGDWPGSQHLFEGLL